MTPADTFAGFAHECVDAAIIPPLTPAQEAFLESCDGTRAPMDREHAALIARRAGKRHLRALVAAHLIRSGHSVIQLAADPAIAEQARQDALDLLDDLERSYSTLRVDDQAA